MAIWAVLVFLIELAFLFSNNQSIVAMEGPGSIGQFGSPKSLGYPDLFPGLQPHAETGRGLNPRASGRRFPERSRCSTSAANSPYPEFSVDYNSVAPPALLLHGRNTAALVSRRPGLVHHRGRPTCINARAVARSPSLRHAVPFPSPSRPQHRRCKISTSTDTFVSVR